MKCIEVNKVTEVNEVNKVNEVTKITEVKMKQKKWSVLGSGLH